jgi:hypothetical protein
MSAGGSVLVNDTSALIVYHAGDEQGTSYGVHTNDTEIT